MLVSFWQVALVNRDHQSPIFRRTKSLNEQLPDMVVRLIEWLGTVQHKDSNSGAGERLTRAINTDPLDNIFGLGDPGCIKQRRRYSAQINRLGNDIPGRSGNVGHDR